MPVISRRGPAPLVLVLTFVASALSLVAAPGRAAAATCEQSVRDVPAPLVNTIPDGSNHQSTVDMPEDGTAVTGVAVAVDLHHANLADLSITLQWFDDAGVASSPEVTLVGLGTLSGANLAGTVLDDAAATSITTGTAPYTGTFRPAQPLSGVVGHIGGKYVLKVEDHVNGDGDSGGVLDDWTLTLRYATCDLDSDAVEDHVDACPGAAGDPATGCPVPVAEVSAAYRRGRFRGVVSSPVAACSVARPVTVWKVRPGPDRALGTRSTRSDGSYRLLRARHPGRYYATVPTLLVPGVADCPSVSSPRFRIR
ncbi:hypothetical protein [Nocardioides pocheonensis]|uniref:P/Homo B domain-containing protein n=1 Tax=Nocardioides pocheonensis TaxID=661485 RepID=A0A3N0GW51_9ACTN|nr:hypothetical protein [Nocardioides pocheonensis]RNM16368.1 hypothetical protein EFL26_05325 [Nocardioides pocheonensis]